MRARQVLATSWFGLMAAALVGCDSDGAVDGARGACAEGGALGDCAQAVSTSEDACDRLVACAAIPRDGAGDNDFDWGRCVDRMQSLIPTQERFAIACIGASSCDDLKVEGSPVDPNRIFCLQFGDR